jgi:hypothetical protein
LRWAAAAIFALVLLAFGLIHQGVAPRTEVAQTTTTAAAAQVAPADPDDVLLENVHASLQREVPAPLAPAAMLVEEMASASNQAQQTKEN